MKKQTSTPELPAAAEIVNEQSLIEEIVRLHGEICGMAVSAVEKAVRIGNHLQTLKASRKHGEWQHYVDTNLQFSARTASNYMRAAAEVEKNPQLLANAKGESLEQFLSSIAIPRKPKLLTSGPEETPVKACAPASVTPEINIDTQPLISVTNDEDLPAPEAGQGQTTPVKVCAPPSPMPEVDVGTVPQISATGEEDLPSPEACQAKPLSPTPVTGVSSIRVITERTGKARYECVAIDLSQHRGAKVNLARLNTVAEANAVIVVRLDAHDIPLALKTSEKPFHYGGMLVTADATITAEDPVPVTPVLVLFKGLRDRRGQLPPVLLPGIQDQWSERVLNYVTRSLGVPMAEEVLLYPVDDLIDSV